MIADLKPYPAMKGSGVPWLGEVPGQWAVRRLRNAAEMRVSNVDKHAKDDEQPVRLCNYVDVYKNDRIRERMAFMRATATLEEIERFRLETGDVLITKDSETWNDIGVPALVEERADDLICGYHLALLRPFHDRLYGAYLFRALQSTAVSYQFHVEANGVTRCGLSHAAIKSIWLPLPPLPEQAAIVRFLDYADRRIRRYIRAKQKLIKLLEEQKQAIIHRAVTRGLDPNVRLKPSGVEWLGDVPEHWDVRRIRTCLESVTTGLWGDDPSSTNASDHVVCVRVADFDMGRMEVGNRRLTTRALPPSARQSRRLAVGDLLIEKSGGGDAQPVGRVVGFSLPQPAVCSNFVARLRPSPSVVRSKYLLYVLTLLQSTRRNVPSIKQTTGIQNLDTRHYFANLTAVPPLREQDEILAVIDASMTAVRNAEERARLEIDLIRDYRTRLIADVVTGKLDVREAAARLPDETDEPEPPDETDPTIDADEGTADDLDAVPEAVEA